MVDLLSPTPGPLGIEILVMPETTLLQVAAVVDPFRAANRLMGRRLFDWSFATPDGQPAPTRSGVPVPAARAFGAEGADLLVVTGSYEIERQTTPALIRALAAAGRRRAMVVGVEAGVWLLAHAGLLTGRRAVIHWEDHDAFAARFPEIEVVPRRFLIEGSRATAGGSGPAIDLMLEIIRRRQGYPLALEVARALIYDPSASTEQTAPRTLGRPLSPSLARAMAAMEQSLDAPLPIARIARGAGVSARHLQSLFHRELGVGPAAHYQALRLNEARRLLIETAAPVLDVAAAAGFASAAAFTRAYRRRHGESPTDTRRAARG